MNRNGPEKRCGWRLRPLCDPDSVGILGHIEVQDLTPVVADHEKGIPNVSVGTVKKSIAAIASR
jgi:hypothetical protein